MTTPSGDDPDPPPSDTPGPSGGTPSPESRRAEIRLNLIRLGEMGVSDSDIQSLLGMEKNYFERFKDVALGHRRVDGTNAERILAGRTDRSLKAIIAFAARHSARSTERTRTQYIADIRRELASLENSDSHTLISIQPPLEADSKEIRQAVVLAAARGVRLNYYLPSQSALNDNIKKLREGPNAQQLATCLRAFAWMPEVATRTMQLMRSLCSEAREMELSHEDSRPPNSTFLAKLCENVQFGVFGWLFLSFNEKILCIRSRGRTSVRKETLVVSGNPDTEEHWVSTAFPMAPDILDALVLASSERIISWDAANSDSP